MRSASSVVALALATVSTTDAFVPGVVQSPVHAGPRLVGVNKCFLQSYTLVSSSSRALSALLCYEHRAHLDVPYV